MAATLGDGQFEIDGVAFGGVWDAVKVDKVDWPQHSWDVQDTDNQFRSGILMGSDLLRPGFLDFSLRTDTYSVNEAQDAAEALAVPWLRGGEKDPRSLSCLRYRLGNRTRRVYGRGREFVHSLDQWTYAGTSPIDAGFKMVDPFFYADEERSVDIGYVPAVTGGLTFPIEFPIEFQGTGENNVGGFISDVGGTVPTPVIIELMGPTQFAIVSGDGWTVAYDSPIAADQVVTIDTRYGFAVVYDNFGKVRNGNLTWKTNLSRARITPGSETISYAGYDLTGSSRARVRWRPAYHTY